MRRWSRPRWGPGAPRVLPTRPIPQPPVQQVAPIGAARIPAAPAAAYVPPMQAQPAAVPTHVAAAPSNPELRTTFAPLGADRANDFLEQIKQRRAATRKPTTIKS